MPRPDPRVRLGVFQTLPGRVGSGQEVVRDITGQKGSGQKVVKSHESGQHHLDPTHPAEDDPARD